MTGFSSIPFRNALRSVRRRPAFFIIATLSMGLALGICITAFTLTDTVTHPRLAYADPDRTVVITLAGGDQSTGALAGERIAALRQQREFSSIALADFGTKATIQIRDNIDRRAAVRVTPGFFEALGVAPERGRALTDADADRGDAVVVSSAFWRRWFRGSELSEATITSGGQTYRIVGVIPTSVRIPRDDVELWYPMTASDAATGAPMVVARLRDGVGVERATQVAQQITARFSADRNPTRPLTANVMTLSPAQRDTDGRIRPEILIPFLVLIIACANVAALMLARTVAQRRDIALRLALGARVRTLVVDQLIEVGLIGVVGGAIGLLLAEYLSGAFAAGMPSSFAGTSVIFDPHVSWRAVTFAFIAIATSMVVTTMIPAGHVATMQPASPLKDSSSTTTGQAIRSLRHIVFLELMLTMTLLVVASLTVRGTETAESISLGFDVEPLRRVFALTPTGDSAAFGAAGVESALIGRLRATPGVVAVTAFDIESTGGGARVGDSIRSEHTLATKQALVDATKVSAGPGLLATLELALVRGRDFDEADRSSGAAILDANAAALLFPNRDAVGQMIEVGDDASARVREGRDARRWIHVIGVTGVARTVYGGKPDAPPRATVFVARGRVNPRIATIAVRLDPRAPAAVASVQRTLQSSLPLRSRVEFTRFSVALDNDMRAVRFVGNVFGFIALSGLCLAAIGVFAVVSYAVSQRTREFAVRIALGAQTNSIVGLVLKDGLFLGISGTVAGGMLGVVLGFAMRSMFYGVEATDPVSLVRAALMLTAIAIVACLVPAARAMRANPVDVMRAS